jgi:hypothetical protein
MTEIRPHKSSHTTPEGSVAAVIGFAEPVTKGVVAGSGPRPLCRLSTLGRPVPVPHRPLQGQLYSSWALFYVEHKLLKLKGFRHVFRHSLVSHHCFSLFYQDMCPPSTQDILYTQIRPLRTLLQEKRRKRENALRECLSRFSIIAVVRYVLTSNCHRIVVDYRFLYQGRSSKSCPHIANIPCTQPTPPTSPSVQTAQHQQSLAILVMAPSLSARSQIPMQKPFFRHPNFHQEATSRPEKRHMDLEGVMLDA